MARRVKVLYVCDLDEKEDDVATVAFSANGKDYEMELCGDHRTTFTVMMREYVSRARTEGGRRQPRAAERRPGDEQDVAAIREWGNANGYAVSERGRVAAEVKEAYHAATR